MTKEKFIEKSNKIHNNKYDYSEVQYIDNNTKVCIICPIHGKFYQKPKLHIKGYGCSKCSKKYQWKTAEWIYECAKIHNNKYDYSKVDYINANTKVCIICPEHGEFWMTPTAHMYQRQNCPDCAKKETAIKRTKNTDWFIRTSI